MIGIEGSYLLRANIDGFDDFLNESNLVSFIVLEEAGNLLPTCQMVFGCDIEKLLAKFHEGVVFKVSMGKSKDNMNDFSFRVLNITVTKTQTVYNVELSAILDALDYLVQGRVRTFPKDSAANTIKKIAEKYFSWDKNNITSSKDSQPWIQYGITDKKMIDDMWLLSDVGDKDVPLCGITSSKSFIYRSLLLNSGKYDWKFSTIPDQNARSVGVMTDYLVETLGNLTNLWTGYGRKKLIYDLEEGTSSDNLFIPKPFVALAKEINKAKAVEYAVTEAGTVSKNVDRNYWKTYYNNLSNLVMMSTVHLSLSIRQSYYPIKLLDRVMFTDYGIDGTTKTSSPYSGIYFITKIVKQVVDKELYTQVELTREALNKAV